MWRPSVSARSSVGILSAAALTAFLTGVTEPLEFAFMFAAFPLYVVHAVLTGCPGHRVRARHPSRLLVLRRPRRSAALRDGAAAKNIPLLIGMGVVFFVVYLLFRLVITKWNMRTPGREPENEFEAEEQANVGDGGDSATSVTAASSTSRARRPAGPNNSSPRSAGGTTW